MDLSPKLEDMVFLLTHLCEIEPVSSQIFLAELKKARWFSFREKSTKKLSRLPLPLDLLLLKPFNQ